MNTSARVRFVAKIGTDLTLNGEAPASCSLDQLGEIVALLYSVRCKPNDPFVLKPRKVVRLVGDESILLYYDLVSFVYDGHNLKEDIELSLKVPMAVEPEIVGYPEQYEKLLLLNDDSSLTRNRLYYDYYPWVCREPLKDRQTSEIPPNIPRWMSFNHLMEALLLPPHQLNEVAVYLQNAFLFSSRVMMK